jgi:hypothetical protein
VETLSKNPDPAVLLNEVRITPFVMGGKNAWFGLESRRTHRLRDRAPFIDRVVSPIKWRSLDYDTYYRNTHKAPRTREVAEAEQRSMKYILAKSRD